jgi:hypothetical protein
MKPAELRASVSKTPFRPFRLKLTDGREIVCDDPDGWCIAETGSISSVPRRRAEWLTAKTERTASRVVENMR